ncbi:MULTISPECIES: restriction endonuclease [unclassified Maridesulfovibrio]|uniref:restriction endonuclease n=1 Tax=unclassified Maridesulfovibrio TaxID=2794999 RepID=UPI003B3F965E
MSERKRNPHQSIRAYCLWCMGGSPQLVRECEDSDCSLYDLRGPKTEESQRTCIRAIRRHCLACTVGDRQAIRDCKEKECVIRRFRFGVHPKTMQKRRKRQIEKSHLMLPGL